MIQLPTKLCASVLALVLGGFLGAGCIDNSGNKSYPRGDGSVDAAADAEEDAPASTDAPAATDAPATDTHAGDTATGDTTTAGDVAADHGADALSIDAHLDLLPGG